MPNTWRTLCVCTLALACGRVAGRRAESGTPLGRSALRPLEPGACPPRRTGDAAGGACDRARAAALGPPAMRVRGGRSLDELTAKVKASYLSITPIVRGWVTATVAITLLFAIGAVTPELLQFDWAAATSGLQLWRPLTGALFVGQLNPQILMRCYYWLTYGQELERALGTLSFARAMATLIALLCYAAKWLRWPFVADSLIMALTMISTRLHPDARVSLFGIPLKNKYLPFVMIISNYISQQKPPVQDALGCAVGFAWSLLAKLKERELGGAPASAGAGADGAPEEGAPAPKPKKKPGRRRSGSIVTDEQR
ncbi:hypothetical protein KFE25_014251 [Diacronema lutheri]|uniref:Derlin n=2 Tax=Diacronema lutheri TaxID=2081491 RepID=A0A8J5X3M2_DIALT|nr:hypothetical protein KFE25_014251 [Diacronema lutheri]